MFSASQRWLFAEEGLLSAEELALEEYPAGLDDHLLDPPQDDKGLKLLQTLMAPELVRIEEQKGMVAQPATQELHSKWATDSIANASTSDAASKEVDAEKVVWFLGFSVHKVQTRFLDVHYQFSAYKDANHTLEQRCSKLQAKVIAFNEFVEEVQQQMMHVRFKLLHLDEVSERQWFQLQVLQDHFQECIQQRSQQQQLHLRQVENMEAQLSTKKDALAHLKTVHAEVLEDERCEHHRTIEALKKAHNDEKRSLQQQCMTMHHELLVVEEEKNLLSKKNPQTPSFACLMRERDMLRSENDMLLSANKSLDEHVKMLVQQLEEAQVTIFKQESSNMAAQDKNLMRIASLETALKREQNLTLPSSQQSRCSSMTVPNEAIALKEYDDVIAQTLREEEDLVCHVNYAAAAKMNSLGTLFVQSSWTTDSNTASIAGEPDFELKHLERTPTSKSSKSTEHVIEPCSTHGRYPQLGSFKCNV